MKVITGLVGLAIVAAACVSPTDAARSIDPEAPTTEPPTMVPPGTTATTSPATIGLPTTAITTSTSTAPTSSQTSTTSTPPTTTPSPTTTVPRSGSPEVVRLRIESHVTDVDTASLIDAALATLNDPRGWVRAGFTFVADDDAEFRLILAEGPEVDELCFPLTTVSKVSCQNGPVVALNADRWRIGVTHWDTGLPEYRGYLVNHEVGHLVGQRHPQPRCPVQGRPAGVMEPQTGNLKGCTGNAWPREWEIEYAAHRPVVYAPLPDWAPDPVPVNRES